MKQIKCIILHIAIVVATASLVVMLPEMLK